MVNQIKGSEKVHYNYRKGAMCNQPVGFTYKLVQTTVRKEVTCGKCVRLMSRVVEL